MGYLIKPGRANMTDIKHILSNLGWPDHAAAHRGTMTWSAATGGAETLRATSASVVVNHTTIRARVRSITEDAAGLQPHLEASWQMEGENAKLADLVVDGQAQEFDEARAIQVFQDAVNRIGAKPVFQKMAERKTPDSARLSTPRQ